MTQWGRKHQQSIKPEADWIRQPAPTLQIVTDDEWTAAHARMSAARAIYFTATRGQTFRTSGARESVEVPADESGALRVLRRDRSRCGRGRRAPDASSSTAARGITSAGGRSAPTGADVPMVDADDIVIEALLDDVLDQQLLEDSVGEALRLLQGENRKTGSS